MNSASDQMVAAESEALKEAQRQYLFACVGTYYEEPLVLEEGNGCWVTDSRGRQYLDLFAGILTTSVGHCHPEVVDRVQQQTAKLGHTATLYVTEQQVDVARTLAELSPGSLETSFFTNSGTEAVETAVMLAFLYTGSSEIIALRHAYAGRSMLATNITAQSPWRPMMSSIAGIKHVMSPYSYRCPFKPGDDEAYVETLAQDLEDLIQTTTNGRPAAFMAETIQGIGGFVVPPPGYFRRMADIIHSHGGLFICDEVQAGFGRTGDKWFGIEHWGVEPDIMVMAKGIANGFPVGATITRKEIADAFSAKTISTFGGNPICMAAAAATLDVMQREDVPGRSAARGQQLRAGLDQLADQHAWIGDIRGMGLMQAMELVEDRETKEPSARMGSALMEASKKEGLLIGLGGLHGHVIRLGPSMLISEQEVAEALGRLGRACERAEKSAQ